MSLNVNVQGGTGGGKKKPMAGPAEDWFCLCRNPPLVNKERVMGDVDAGRITLAQANRALAEAKLNRSYLVRCPDCKMERP